MKFDYIVMNPPYTAPGTSNSKSKQNLDELFLSKAIELADTVVSIQPATWFLNDSKRVRMLEGRRCDVNIISNGYELFQNEGASVRLTLGIFKVTRGSGMTVMYDNSNKMSYDSAADFSQMDRYSVLRSVVEKGKVLGSEVIKTHMFTQGHGIAKFLPDSSSLKGKWTVKITDQNPATTSDIYDTIWLRGGAGLPKLNDGITKVGELFAVFDTQDEAEHFAHYMMTDFVRAYVKAYRIGKKVYHAIKYIPWPDAGFTDDWDDDRIAQEIGLTDDERKELASILPDCYGIRKNIPATV